jgi:hypothetical protein
MSASNPTINLAEVCDLLQFLESEKVIQTTTSSSKKERVMMDMILDPNNVDEMRIAQLEFERDKANWEHSINARVKLDSRRSSTSRDPRRM